MSNSLADQLLKAGLVTADKVKKSTQKRPHKQAKKPHAKSQRNSKSKTSSHTQAGVPQGVANAEARKALASGTQAHAKDAEKRAQQEQAEKRRLLNVQIMQVLKEVDAQDPDPKGEEKFNYSYQGKVRGIYISKVQREKLSSGELAITILKAKTKLIPVAVVDALLAIDPERFIYRLGDETEEQSSDDDYAGYDVPDDLIW